MEGYRYVLITPARNEEAFIEKTIRSVISQTVTPVKWVVVSDGSTDRTDEIVAGYAKSHGFIELLSKSGDQSRNFGSQVRAINAGCERLRGVDYDFIGNLDADVSFGPDYYESVLKRFSSRPALGLAGGYICEETGGVFKPRVSNRTTSVAHAIQLFRRRCFEDIGGYLPMKYGGSDWHAEVMARLKGWEVQAFPDLPVNHHKPSLTAEGILRGGYRQGRMDYAVGCGPVFEVLKCLSRANLKPYGLYAAARLTGFVAGCLAREVRPVSGEFIRQLRREQRRKMLGLLLHSNVNGEWKWNKR